MTASLTARTELRCMAPHPLRERYPQRFARRLCGTFIITLPAACEPTGRILKGESEVVAGMIPARCPKCSSYTEYEVKPPEGVAA